MSKFLLASAIVLISFSSHAEQVSKMRTFLTDCAYGTIGGALVGVATLAISDNPNTKMNNVARGASLGLYAGIFYGFYELNQKANPDYESSFRMHFEPLLLVQNGRQSLDGLQSVFRLSSF